MNYLLIIETTINKKRSLTADQTSVSLFSLEMKKIFRDTPREI